MNVSYADSSQLLAPPSEPTQDINKANSTVTNIYSGNPTTDSNNGVLIPCPTPISGCPNIDGSYPQGGSAATCPPYCYVSSQITYNTATSTANLQQFVPAVVQYAAPQCPTGYFPGAQFNLSNAGPGVSGADDTNYVWASPAAVSPVDSATYNAITAYNTANPANTITCSASGPAASTPVTAGSCPGPCSAAVGTPTAGSSACAPSENTNMIYLNQCVADGNGNYSYSYREMACTPLPGFYSATVMNPAASATTNTSQVCTLSSTSWNH
jgi:hypothetical protein